MGLKAVVAGVLKLTSNDGSIILNPTTGAGIVDLSVAGGGGGVTSLNSLTGALNITSSNSSVSITPSGSTIDLSASFATLSDVQVTSPQVGDLLYYNGTKYANFPRPTGGGVKNLQNNSAGALTWVIPPSNVTPSWNQVLNQGRTSSGQNPQLTTTDHFEIRDSSNYIGSSGSGIIDIVGSGVINLTPTTSTNTAFPIVSTVATGTAPFTVASTTNVANLNASTLTGSAVGTSGATIPLLNAANTWSATQTHNAVNIATDTTTGMQIATATNQKLGFFGKTPVVQITGSTDILAGLVTLGLRAASSNPALNMGTGVLTSGTHNVTSNTTGLTVSNNPNNSNASLTAGALSINATVSLNSMVYGNGTITFTDGGSGQADSISFDLNNINLSPFTQTYTAKPFVIKDLVKLYVGDNFDVSGNYSLMNNDGELDITGENIGVNGSLNFINFSGISGSGVGSLTFSDAGMTLGTTTAGKTLTVGLTTLHSTANAIAASRLISSGTTGVIVSNTIVKSTNATNSAATVNAGNNQAQYAGSGNLTASTGAGGLTAGRNFINCQAGGTGTVTLGTGSSAGIIGVSGVSPTFTDFAAFHVESNAPGGIIFTNRSGLWVKNQQAFGTGGSCVTDYGIRIDALNRATNNYQIALDGTGGGIHFNTPTAAGTERLYASATSTLDLTANTTLNQRIGGTVQIAINNNTVDFTGKFTKYNNITTAGWGVPAIYGSGRSTAQTAAVASVATYTVGAADGSFEVSANVLVTTATLHNFTVTVAYTDEGNTARTVTMQLSTLAGAFITAITNAQGTVPYEGVPLHIRCKASTAIIIATTGTFTTVTYNVEGNIRQIA